jgi:glutamine amidotransferase-like uncharacterized protein
MSRSEVVLFLIVALSFTVAFFVRPSREPSPPEGSLPQGETAIIALYSDQGTWEESVRAAESMFKWMNYTVEMVDADYINEEGLDNFVVLCVPGGDMYQYSQDISSKGFENIRDFVRGGGGYLGICGGAYLASERIVWRGRQLQMRSLELFHGSAEGPIDDIVPYPNYTVCKINILDFEHPITRSEPDFEWMLYYWSPKLVPYEDAEVTILGRYDGVDQPSVLSFEYGHGRVFLIGAHPEIEEDDERDGVDFADELYDHGSDWDLMKKAVLWLSGESH